MKLFNLLFCLAYCGDFHQRRRFQGFHTKRFIKSAQFNDDDRTNWTQGCNLWLIPWSLTNEKLQLVILLYGIYTGRIWILRSEINGPSADQPFGPLIAHWGSSAIQSGINKISTVSRFKILSLIFWTPYDMFEDEPEFKLNILCIRYVYICHKIL